MSKIVLSSESDEEKKKKGERHADEQRMQGGRDDINRNRTKRKREK